MAEFGEKVPYGSEYSVIVSGPRRGQFDGPYLFEAKVPAVSDDLIPWVEEDLAAMWDALRALGFQIGVKRRDFIDSPMGASPVEPTEPTDPPDSSPAP